MNEQKIFVSVKDACALTGLPCYKIRAGCKAGTIPHIKTGDSKNSKFLINMPLLIEQMKIESWRA